MKKNNLAGKTVCILDAHGILYQLFHALPPMSSPQGEPVGAVYGFVRDLFSLLDKHKPDYLFCAFDMHGPTFRSGIYPQYKANRAPMPDDLRPQIQSARDVLDAMGVLPLGLEGFEADDILATVARQAEKFGGNCVIVSSDKDCRQLISEHISLFNLRKQNFYTAEDLQADWGIRPDQVVDFQSLVGDSSDNVPGVPLIGPKIASELLNKFETLEGVYEHVSEISGKKRQENIAGGKDSALMSRELVRLRDDVPVEIDWNHSTYKGYDADKLRDLFRRFGFKSLLSKLDGKSFRNENIENRSPSLFDQLDVPEQTKVPISNAANTVLKPNVSERLPSGRMPKKPTYHLVDTPEKFDDFFAELKKQTIFSFDTETAPMEARFEATSPRYTKIVGMSFAFSDDEAWYLPFRGPLGAETLNQKTTLETLRPIFENPKIGKLGQNLKYDIVVLENAELNPPLKLRGLVFDTMIADYLLHAGEMNHNLDDMAELYLQYITTKISELIGTGKKQKRMDEIPTEVVCDYAGEDALVVWQLYPILKGKIESMPEISKLFGELEIPLSNVLADMEYCGIRVDTEVLKKLSDRFGSKLKELEKEIYSLAGHEFNVASPKQLAVVLFDELGLRVVKKTKTGASTDMEVLEELQDEHPLCEKVVLHRQLSKLKGTYVDALPELIHPVTGRIHSSFNQVATATGRLSSSNPNLQNIPIRSEEGREIRSAFKPGNGFDYLLSCDYSQIELRVLAHFSEDQRLCESFRNNEDIHARVAGEVFNVDLDEVDSDMRRTAKAVNFGVIYGQTAFGLAKQLGIPQGEAQEFIDGYFAKYSSIRFYLESILDDCIEKGFVSTLLGRRRYFREGTIRSVRRGGLNQAERMAINTVIQGTAADLMKQAMVELQNTLPKNIKANLLLQIHDELVFEVAKDDAERLKKIVVDTMSLGQPLRVPLVVDAELGKSWDD